MSAIQNAINGRALTALKAQATATVGSTASVDIVVPSNSVLIEISDVVTATASRSLVIQFSTDGGSTFTTATDFAVNYFANISATTFTNLNGSGVAPVLLSATLDDAGSPSQFSVMIYALPGAVIPMWMGSFSQTFTGPPITSISGTMFGTLTSALNINLLRISLDDGTSTFGGVVRVYELIGA